MTGNRQRLGMIVAASLALSGCGGTQSPSSPGVSVVTASATVAPAPTATPTPSSISTQTKTAATAGLAPSAALPPLDLSDMRLWNYAGRWHASEWPDDFSPIPWRYDHVTQPTGTDTYFRLDAAGAPELQAMGGTPVSGRALWEADVTLPQLKDGLVVAPLWLWDSGSSDEVDFEFAGRNGLSVTMHAAVDGVMQQSSVRLFAGRDMSGERHRFGIKVDETAGYVEMYVDGAMVQHWDRGGATPFVSHPLKPILSMWAADPTNAGFVYWAGRWPGLAAGETLTMTVHGYGYTPLP